MINETGQGNKEFEARTAQFFDQNFTDLSESLRGKTIVDPKSGKRLTISSTEAYDAESNSKGIYRPLHRMAPGTLVGLEWPFRKTRLPLIAAKQDDRPGACVRIMEATISEAGKIQTIKGRVIAEHIGIGADEQVQLVFTDPSETLFVSRFGEEMSEITSTVQDINPGDEIDRVFEQSFS